MKKILFLIFLIIILYAQGYEKIISSSYLNDYGYVFLQNVCDKFGGRLMGNENNYKAFEYLAKCLNEKVIKFEIEEFTAPCYIRKDEGLKLVYPFFRNLKSISIGYSPRTDTIIAEIYTLKNLKSSDSLYLKDKIILFNKSYYEDKNPPNKKELTKLLKKFEAKALLIVNDNQGFTNLVSTGDFKGEELSIPVFSITYEDGLMLQRMLQNNIIPKILLYNFSYTEKKTVPNLVVNYPGKVKDKIVVVAHFDSWDIGQGAMDNGVGSALLFHLINVFNDIKPTTYYSIDFVFTNGEELGLFGSKAYYEKHKNENLLACINLDMTGLPYGFNLMGYDSLKTLIEEFANELKGFNLNKVISIPWLNSDHMPFMINGIPSINPLAKLDEFKIQYYHDFTDTFEKVNKKYISDASAIIGSLIFKLSNKSDISKYRLSKEKTNKMLEKYNLLKEIY